MKFETKSKNYCLVIRCNYNDNITWIGDIVAKEPTSGESRTLSNVEVLICLCARVTIHPVAAIIHIRISRSNLCYILTCIENLKTV